MSFQHVPTRVFDHPFCGDQAAELVKLKREATGCDDHGYFIWPSDSHRPSFLAHHGGLSQVVDFICAGPQVHSSDTHRVQSMPPWRGCVYGSHQLCHSLSAHLHRMQAYQDLVSYGFSDPQLLSRYVEFLDHLVQSAPQRVSVDPYPYMLTDKTGEVIPFECDRSGYKKQLSLLKSLIQKSTLKKTDLNQYMSQLRFPDGATLGWLDYKPFEDVDIRCSSSLSSIQIGSWNAPQIWVDHIISVIHDFPDTHHEITMDFEYPPLEYVLFEHLRDRCENLSESYFKQNHLNKWLYGDHRLGRFLSFLSQVQDIRSAGELSKAQTAPQKTHHYIRMDESGTWSLKMITMSEPVSQSSSKVTKA